MKIGFLSLSLAAGLIMAGCGADRNASNSPYTGDRGVNASRPNAATEDSGSADRMQTGQAGSADRAGKSANLSAADRQFAMKAAMGGLMEVQLGQMAQQNGQSSHVKQLGQRLQEDHGKANDELKRIAAEKGIDLPASLDAEHRKHLDQLKGMNGAQFDRAFLRQQVEHHKMDIADFQKASQTAMDPDLKNFAEKNLPVLQEHLQMAQSGQGARGQGGAGHDATNSGTDSQGKTKR